MAQLDSARDSDSRGRRFESCRVGQKNDKIRQNFVVFQLYSPLASSMHFVRDIAIGSDMRFARWKLQGEYNITAERSGAISLLQSKNITPSRARHITKKILTAQHYAYKV